MELLRRAQLLTGLVLGDQIVEVLRDPYGNVEADLVLQAEGGGLWMSDQGPGDRVYLLDAVAILEGVAYRVDHGERTQPVPDEVRGVLCHHATLAQDPLPEGSHILDDVGIRVLGRDDLQQL